MADEFVMPALDPIAEAFSGIPSAVLYGEYVAAQWETALLGGINHAAAMYRRELDDLGSDVVVYVEGDEVVVDLRSQKAFDDEFGTVERRPIGDGEETGLFASPVNSPVTNTLREHASDAEAIIDRYIDFGGLR